MVSVVDGGGRRKRADLRRVAIIQNEEEAKPHLQLGTCRLAKPYLQLGTCRVHRTACKSYVWAILLCNKELNVTIYDKILLRRDAAALMI